MEINKSYDYIVIGSGAAGGVIFNELKKQDKNVLLVEQGDYPKIKSYDFYYSLKNFWKSSGYQYARGNIYLPLLQGVSVGGSTRINGSIMQTITEKFVSKLNKFLNLKSSNFQFEEFLKYQDELIEEFKILRKYENNIENNNIYQLTKKLGWNCKPQLRTALDDSIKKNIDTGNSIENLILRKFSKNNILYNFEVDKLVFENRKIIGLNCVNKYLKKKIFIRANRKVIICCGVIGTAKLLMNSKIKNKNIGKKFSCHLSGAVDSLFENKKNIELLSEEVEIITNNEKFASQKVPSEVILSRLPIKKNNSFFNENNFTSSWVYNVSSSSSGSLSRGLFGYKLKFDINNDEFQKVKDFIILISKFLFNLGAQKVFPNIINKKIDGSSFENLQKIIDEINPEDLLLTASHLFGTCCFGNNSENGVINENFKVFNYDNLFVVDSSIFPFPTESNPQLTIMIFAKAASQIILNDQ